MKLTINSLLKQIKSIKDSNIEINGWVKSNRSNKNFGFIDFNDGTVITNIQIVYKENCLNFNDLTKIRSGSVIKVLGKLILTPKAKQPFEILAIEIIILKQADEDYPIQKKRHNNEYLRTIAHVRPRTNLFRNIMSVRSSLYKFINDYFFINNFTWVTTPILTSNDAEGAGECFKLEKISQEEFFGKEINLSVTGQLHAEAYAMAFQKVYTFGPQFRAEKSHTNRHVAEFWMLEPEMAFCDLEKLMDLIEDMIKFIACEYQKNNSQEINFFNEFIDINSKKRIEEIGAKPFIRISYREVIEILLKALENGVKFENEKIHFGIDLDSEHEKYICEIEFNQPTFVYNYPTEIKAFYMKRNSDNTVRGVDLLVPGVGELCGGSQREDDYNLLLERIGNNKETIESLQWYLDLRRFGYHSSAGFGLGFDRLIMYFTGITNIRDVIPFPRTHGNAKF